MAKKGQKFNKYTVEFRQEVVQKYFDGKGSASALTGQTGAAASQQTTSTTKPATTTKPVVTTTATPVNPGDTSVTIAGDANCDGVITMADAAAIFQHLGNFDKYALSAQGAANADVFNKGDGITSSDALSVQKYNAKLITSLPESVQ